MILWVKNVEQMGKKLDTLLRDHFACRLSPAALLISALPFDFFWFLFCWQIDFGRMVDVIIDWFILMTLFCVRMCCFGRSREQEKQAEANIFDIDSSSVCWKIDRRKQREQEREINSPFALESTLYRPMKDSPMVRIDASTHNPYSNWSHQVVIDLRAFVSNGLQQTIAAKPLLPHAVDGALASKNSHLLRHFDVDDVLSVVPLAMSADMCARLNWVAFEQMQRPHLWVAVGWDSCDSVSDW